MCLLIYFATCFPALLGTRQLKMDWDATCAPLMTLACCVSFCPVLYLKINEAAQSLTLVFARLFSTVSCGCWCHIHLLSFLCSSSLQSEIIYGGAQLCNKLLFSICYPTLNLSCGSCMNWTRFSSWKGDQALAQLPRAVVGSPSPEGFKNCVTMAPGDMV